MGRDAVGAAAEAGGRVRLRVEVDEQAALAGLRETRGEVDGGRRLADAALLVRDCVDASGHRSQASRGGGRVRSSALCQASGRFFATPVRRGKPGGVGPVLRIASKPGGRRLERAADPLGDRGDALRLGGLARPRGRRGRLRGRAAGTTRPRSAGGRAPSRPRRRTSPSGCSSARPQSTARFGISGSHVSRKRHLRRSASSSVTARAGSETASGIPGVPPPEPTSTMRPLRRRRAPPPEARRRSSMRRAAAGSRDRGQPRGREDRREPAVEDATAHAGSVRGAAREDDDEPGRLGCPRSTSRPRDRPSAARARSGARPRSSARARRGGPWRQPARPPGAPTVSSVAARRAR